mmetsp:Transcript_107402/g.210538  ORF Transcript_107402/g.210538 Transcript_107402/m.210538 type:complete len:314 (+) Transcript_107402:6-947(+)
MLGLVCVTVIFCLASLYGVVRGDVFDAYSSPYSLEALNASHHDKNMLLTQHLPMILALESRILEKKAFSKLIGGLERYIKEHEPINSWFDPQPFKDLIPAIHIHPTLVHPSDGAGDNEKYFIGNEAINEAGKDYIVYAAGVAGQPNFENYMSRLGASVYAFDCTDKKRFNYNFNFYEWCIGKEKSFEGSRYAHGQDTGHEFYSIAEIKEKLGHPKIHMLKMDIEGFEWDLLQNEIVEGEEDALPEQLLFELHTEGANAKFVPPTNVDHKRIDQVNRLVYGLWTRGYRLMNIDINLGDKHCAELAFVRITHSYK